MEL
ncbi:hypothetical protein MIMGU_mgv1a0189932mg, partial [Erythranthe guttata]|jgi:hypothetical protein